MQNQYKIAFFIITIMFYSQKCIIFALRFEKRCKISINFLNMQIMDKKTLIPVVLVTKPAFPRIQEYHFYNGHDHIICEMSRDLDHYMSIYDWYLACITDNLCPCLLSHYK